MEAPLPPLRSDLTIVPSADDDGGALLHDPLARRWHRISREALAVISNWNASRQVIATRCPTLPAERIDATIEFLRRSDLLEVHQPDAKSPRERTWLSRSLHGYLFVRVPLGDPTRALDVLLPIARLLRSRAVQLALLTLLACVSFGLARRAGEIGSAFASAWSPNNAFVLICALGFAKIVHEAGHAFAARLRNVPVPSVGVAFMLLYPVLYTDTTDAWRLSRRDRLRIDLAGIRAEASLGILAAAAWLVLPDGDLRSATFILATVALIGSFAVNLNPFMRFDGYYALADALGMPNLQLRAFAFARWRMRQVLFSTGETPPELIAGTRRRVVLAYAYGTWVYRLILFVGIALLVYHTAFKALGIILFFIEIWWFVLRPVRDELRKWRERAIASSMPRKIGFGLGALLLLAFLFVPWSTTVRVPALLTLETHDVRAPFDGLLSGATELGSVASAAKLGKVRNERLLDRVTVSENEIAVATAREHRARSRAEGRYTLAMHQTSLRAADERYRTDVAALLRSSVRAPVAGTFQPEREADERYVARGERLGTVVTREMIVRAYVPEHQLHRTVLEGPAFFVPSNLKGERRTLHQAKVIARGRDFRDALLLRSHGGQIRGTAQGEDARSEIAYEIRQYVVGRGDLQGPVRGTVHLRAEPEAIIVRFGRHLFGALLREANL